MSAAVEVSELSRRIGRRLRRQSRRIHYRMADPRIRRLATNLRREHLTYLEPEALIDLCDRVRSIERRGVQGELIEAGTARGGSAIMIASRKSLYRRFRIFDTFEMIPPPSARDDDDVHRRYEVIASGAAIGPEGSTYYGYEDDLRGQVEASFIDQGIVPRDHNIQFIPGLFENTLQADGPVALAHIDCDWYESVKVCLERIAPMLEPGGVLVIDDYDAWSGSRAAVDEYFEHRRDRFEFQRRSRLHVVKRPE